MTSIRAHRRARRPYAQALSARPDVQGLVVSYSAAPVAATDSHDVVTRKAMAERIAALKGYEYAGEYDEAECYGAPLYLVPADTLPLDEAHALGVWGEHDLFGGAVPYAFVATKSITHPVHAERARAPSGWSVEFAALVSDAVLPGFSAFSRADAQAAGERLLENGPVRVKPSLAIGGRGQTKVGDAAQLAEALEALDGEEIESCGVVLEQHLDQVTTYSVGQVRVRDLVATYVGTQKLTANESGAQVYGGSDLIVARGDFDALLALDLDAAARDAIDRSRTYDAAVSACFESFFASRRNYDIACGRNAQGAQLCGVLEQSWRIGGATPAEVAALEAFDADAGLRAVRAESTELYGESAQVPGAARVHYRGRDPTLGFLTKYATVQPHVDA